MSNKISIIGIPKTATMEQVIKQVTFFLVQCCSLLTFFLQILGAFATPDGVPIEGMKIKNVVPGKNSFSAHLYGAHNL